MTEGKTYFVKHNRKGNFFMKLTGQCDVWASGEIVGGTAKAMMDYNVKEKGESITVRKSLASFVEQP